MVPSQATRRTILRPWRVGPPATRQEGPSSRASSGDTTQPARRGGRWEGMNPISRAYHQWNDPVLYQNSIARDCAHPGATAVGYRPPAVTLAAPFEFLILLVASWVGRRQGEAIESIGSSRSRQSGMSDPQSRHAAKRFDGSVLSRLPRGRTTERPPGCGHEPARTTGASWVSRDGAPGPIPGSTADTPAGTALR